MKGVIYIPKGHGVEAVAFCTCMVRDRWKGGLGASVKRESGSSGTCADERMGIAYTTSSIWNGPDVIYAWHAKGPSPMNRGSGTCLVKPSGENSRSQGYKIMHNGSKWRNAVFRRDKGGANMGTRLLDRPSPRGWTCWREILKQSRPEAFPIVWGHVREKFQRRTGRCIFLPSLQSCDFGKMFGNSSPLVPTTYAGTSLRCGIA